MKITIYRGTKEIGGTLIELKSSRSRILIDAGYPLFLNGQPIDDDVARLQYERLLELGVLPKISGLYAWNEAQFDAVLISHAHLDHYGLLKYINGNIPIYISSGTKKIIGISQLFKLAESYDLNTIEFSMYEPFQIGDFLVKPYLMDHSAFDAASFEISSEGKTVIYTGDFRGHGRKSVCFERFINIATKQVDILLTEGTMFGRPEEKVMTENDLENKLVEEILLHNGPILFQTSSQNTDRIVSFYKTALRLQRTFVVDVYTANVLFELRELGNKLPYPSEDYGNIKVFYPYRLTQKIFNKIGEDYAKRFSSYHISKESLSKQQDKIVMAVRPSMKRDLEKCNLHNGLFIYSMWQGYRNNDYQLNFEEYLENAGFEMQQIHTSGHASIADIKRIIAELNPKKVVPIHTMVPEAFTNISNKIELKNDGEEFEI
jgi:ribonuclease J